MANTVTIKGVLGAGGGEGVAAESTRADSWFESVAAAEADAAIAAITSSSFPMESKKDVTNIAANKARASA